MKRLPLVLFTLIVISICGATLPAAEQPEAVYNYKTWQCEVDGNKLKLRVKNSLTVLNARGDDYGRFSVTENGFAKLKDVSVKLIDADGNQVFEHNQGDLTKACGYGGVELYTEICRYFEDVKTPRYPYTIEYEYLIEYNSLFFWSTARFQEDIPVLHADYTLIISNDVPFRYKAYVMDLQPTVTEGSHKTTYRWVADSVPALDDYDYVPPDLIDYGRIEFVADRFKLDDFAYIGNSWREVGDWYSRLAADQYLEPGQAPTIKSETGQLARAKGYYKQVTSSTRYVAIGIGISGWQPTKAKTTRQLGYGDCKGMTTLLVSDLHDAGITAYPVLIATRGAGLTDTTFPDFRFNHVITMAVIDKDTVWLDATCDACGFSDLYYSTENRPALVVTDEGGTIRMTPKSTPEQNLAKRETQVTINEDLTAQFTTRLSAYGNYGVFLRGRLPSMDKDELRRFVHAQFSGNDKLYRIKSFEIESSAEPVIISVYGEMIRPADKIGARIYFNPFFMDEISDRERVGLEERPYPVDFLYPHLEHDSVSVRWDSALAIDSVIVPPSDSLETAIAWLKCITSIEKDHAIVDYSRAYTVYMADVNQFDAFDTFRRKKKEVIDGHLKLITDSSK
jgi:hypothetical protein